MIPQREKNKLSIGMILYALLVVFCLVMFLRFLYVSLSPWLPGSGVWPPIVVHFFLMAICYASVFHTDMIFPQINSLIPKFSKKSIKYYLPSIFWLVGVVGMSVVFYQPDSEVDYRYLLTQLFIIALIVPIVEEYFFRGVLGGLLRKKFGVLLGGYASILVFSLVHTQVGFSNLSGLLYLGLGVCLLGIVCEVLYVKSEDIYTAISFHAVANASGVIFLNFCPDLLTKLDIFYQ